VLTLQKTANVTITSVAMGTPFCNRSQNGNAMDNEPLEDLLEKEWLLTNNRGGYASSTIVGCNTRRYHGLLIGSINPSVNRIMALAQCLEMVILNGEVFNLSTIEFDGKFAPSGFRFIRQFRRDTGVHFHYQLDKTEAPKRTVSCLGNPIKLTKSVYLARDADTVVLSYDFTSVAEPIEFVLRPFIGLRDFHTLQKSYAPLCSKPLGNGLMIRHNTSQSCELLLDCPAAIFEKDEQWWFNFVYRKDRQRGQDFTEDLWTPGFFKYQLHSPSKVVLYANLSDHGQPEQLMNNDGVPQTRNSAFGGPGIDTIRQDLQTCQRDIISVAKAGDKKLKTLCLAADQFISERQTNPKQTRYNTGYEQHEKKTTILAGFPWFADWGRDAFISLPGLLLSTGRPDKAKSVLTTFAQTADNGMIPNRFDDNSSTVHFNSVDASLWFINAAFQYLNATGDSATFTQQFLPVIRWIIHSYHHGTRFDIHADADGLITAGNSQTQLTWMDAKYADVAITPRYGKAVEINALWYNSLCWLVQFYTARNVESLEHYKSMADKVAVSFCKLFWNDKTGYLNDCILPDGAVDSSLRPNQIFAVSLPFSPLSVQQQKSVVDVVQKNLLTPYGLRTLIGSDSRYKGIYTGGQQQRDEAYHQGTVWPYLIGPFIEAYLKVNDFSKKSKKEAAVFIEPLMRHLTEDGCLGQICEIFDGDPPHKPKGCFAQAWSIAELIRAYKLINS